MLFRSLGAGGVGGSYLAHWFNTPVWPTMLGSGVLAFVGGRMIVGALRGGQQDSAVQDPTRGWSLVMLSPATSLDALAVGLSLAMLGSSIARPAVVIGLVAAAFTLTGMLLGSLLGRGMYGGGSGGGFGGFDSSDGFGGFGGGDSGGGGASSGW